jgi:hypothetical protein
MFFLTRVKYLINETTIITFGVCKTWEFFWHSTLFITKAMCRFHSNRKGFRGMIVQGDCTFFCWGVSLSYVGFSCKNNNSTFLSLYRRRYSNAGEMSVFLFFYIIAHMVLFKILSLLSSVFMNLSVTSLSVYSGVAVNFRKYYILFIIHTYYSNPDASCSLTVRVFLLLEYF